MSVSGVPTTGMEAHPRESEAAGDVAPGSTQPSERRRILGPGTWKVGGLHPREVKVLTVLGFAVPVVAYLALIQHYSVNAVWQDQWDDVPVIRQSFLHFPDWSSLWSPHVGNRILFPNLIVVTLAHTVSYNIQVEEYLSAVMLIAATAIVIFAHKRRSPNTPLLYYCPVPFLTLTFAQSGNTLWGFQMAWFLVVLCLALTIALLDWDRFAWPFFVAAVLVAVVGSFSSIQGLLIWPVGLVILYHRRRPLWAFVAWIVAAGATAIQYFHNLNYHTPFPGYARQHPYTAAKFFLFALGDVVGVPVKLYGQANAAVMAFGVVIFVLAVAVVLRWGIRRDEHTGAPIGVALIVFGLLFDALITDGRIIFGYFGASQSRYMTNDVLVLAGIYMTVLSGARARAGARRPERTSGTRGQPREAIAWIWNYVERIDRFPFRQVVLAAIAIQLAFSIHYGIVGARGVHQAYVNAAAVTRNIKNEPRTTVIADLYFVSTAARLRSQTQFLEDHHLSLFG